MTSPRRSILLWVLAVIAVLALVAVAAGSRRTGKLQERLNALRAAGFPTTLRELDKWYGEVPAEENGATALLAALNQRKIDASRSLPKRGETWTSNTLAWAADQSAASAQLRQDLHAALQRPRFRFALNLTNGAAGFQLTHLADLKGGAQALNFAAAHAAVLGKTNEAVTAVLDGLRLGQALDAEPVLISYLVRIAIHAIMAGGTEQVLSRLQLPEASLMELQMAFARAGDTRVLARALIGERAFGGDFFQMPPGDFVKMMGLSATGGVPGGTAKPGLDELAAQAMQHLYAATGMRNRDFLFYLDRMAEMIAIAPKVNPQGRSDIAQLESTIQAISGKWQYAITRMTLPALTKAFSKEIRHVALMRSAQTACAIERFRLAHAGRLPEHLDELVPAFLPSVLEDPMDGKPLKFRRLDKGYVVYSVGEDDKDDGGVEPANRPKNGKGGWDYTFVVER